jgi:hypothetical protein
LPKKLIKARSGEFNFNLLSRNRAHTHARPPGLWLFLDHALALKQIRALLHVRPIQADVFRRTRTPAACDHAIFAHATQHPPQQAMRARIQLQAVDRFCFDADGHSLSLVRREVARQREHRQRDKPMAEEGETRGGDAEHE